MSRRRWRPGDVAFFAGFGLLSAGLVVWLVAGLAPAVASAIPSLHDALHRLGGDRPVVVLTARDDAFDRTSLVVRPGPVTVRLENFDRHVQHNVSIYVDGRFTAGSKLTTGPSVREFSFSAPADALVAYRCEIHPFMHGTIQAHGAATPTRGSVLAGRVADAAHGAEPIGQALLDFLFSLLNFGLGAFLVVRCPRDRTAKFFGVAMIATAASYNLQGHAARDVVPALAVPLHELWHPVGGVPYLYAVLLFPDGRLVPRLRTRAARVTYALATLVAIQILLDRAGLLEPGPGPGHIVAFVRFFGLLVPVVGVMAQTYRYRRAETAEVRQQSRLLLWALVPPLALGIATLALTATHRPADPAFGAHLEIERLAFRLSQPTFALIPLALVFGILRFRLWDIDVVVKRTVVFGTLAGFITAVYVGMVTGVGSLLGLGADSSVVLPLAATAVAALAFQPARTTARRLANRLVYGRRATPYEVMSRFSRRLSASMSVDDVLPRLAEAVATGVGASAGRVRLRVGEGGSWTAVHPPGAPDDVAHVVTVTHQGVVVGDLGVTKPPDDPLTRDEEGLLRRLAVQAGPALDNVRLTLDLRARLDELSTRAAQVEGSRRRLLVARDEEHQRLRQDIEDAVERRLVALCADLDEAAASTPVRAGDLLVSVEALAADALEALRGFARGVFPPLLADQGLVPALRAQLRKAPSYVDFHAVGVDGDRFDARAEAGVYFACLRALRASLREPVSVTASVEIRFADGWLYFAVKGIAPTAVDLDAIRDRIEAVGGEVGQHDAGGAVVVEGRVPVGPREADAGVQPSRSAR